MSAAPPPYTVTIRPTADKDCKGIPKNTLRRIYDKIETLKLNPRPSGLEPLGDSYGPGYYRLRVGEYRFVYHVNDTTRHIEVTTIRPRGDVYKRAKRR